MKRILFFVSTLICVTTLFAQKQPQRPSSYNYQRGVEALVDGDITTGLDYLNKELEDNPKNGYAYAWIAAGRASNKEYGMALTAVNKAIQFVPKKDIQYASWVYSLRGNVYLELEDTITALNDYDQAIKIDPTNKGYYETRGDIHFNLGNYELSNKDYSKVIELDAGGVMGYMGLGRNLKGLEEYDKAIELFSYVIKIHPEYSSGYSFRAECLLKKNKYNEAADDILMALDIDEDRKAYYMLVTE